MADFPLQRNCFASRGALFGDRGKLHPLWQVDADPGVTIVTHRVHGAAEDTVLGHIKEEALCLAWEQAASTMDAMLRGALLAPGDGISKLAQGEEVPSSAFQGRLIPEHNADQM